MKINKPLVAILFWLSFVPQICSAQGNSGLAPWYSIEVVLFTRNKSPGATGEIWPVASGELGWESERTENYSLVPTGSWRLSGAEQALKNSQEGLIPVIHTAWRQPVYSQNSARSFYLKSEREIAPGTPLIEGMVKISVSRYLHADLNLILRGTPAGADRLPGGFQTFRFNEHRRMRSRELHYIDHPLMGMLIQITPLNSVESQASEIDDSQEPNSQEVTDEAADTD